ncbi:Pectate lyase superfamily protein [Lacunisphaera limnophila]|uniref:Pectate lyase superfamily protein n=1 Tax=Lacunisphaera limnophila TaxID=1838286 RepID=A0A1I7PHE1_9BACT|nr:right-handed parallel beta-helix repeat-containing protein [Lacunisphaera limnophila]AOS43019.1 Pectate lyase superfamily protein [Lacunisphaera limnophila]
MSPLHAHLPRRGHFLLWLIGCLTLGASLRGESAAAGERIRVPVAAAAGEVGIQAALAGLPPDGGVVELGAGVFTLTRPIVIARDDIELRGQGPATVLFLAPRANCPVVLVGSPATPVDRRVRRVTVRRLLMDGNRTEQQFECYGGPCDESHLTALRNNGLTIRGAEDILVEDVVTRRARSGGVVLEKDCRRVRIDRLEAYENEFDGLAAYETEDSDFTRLNLHHNRSAGFSFDWRFNRNRITDSIASDNGSQGIFMRDSNHNLFERVTLANNGEQGVFLAETRELPGTACRDNRFSGVTITGNGTQGIRVNDASCTPNRLEDSLVKDNRLEGISLAAAGQLEVVRPR